MISSFWIQSMALNVVFVQSSRMSLNVILQLISNMMKIIVLKCI